jgi:hypothetical protein
MEVTVESEATRAHSEHNQRPVLEIQTDVDSRMQASSYYFCQESGILKMLRWYRLGGGVAAREYHEYIYIYIFANMNIHQNLKTDIRIRTNTDGKYLLLSQQYLRIFMNMNTQQIHWEFGGLAATNELLRALLCYLVSLNIVKDLYKSLSCMFNHLIDHHTCRVQPVKQLSK